MAGDVYMGARIILDEERTLAWRRYRRPGCT
jgi:hypothetical protein